MIALALALVLVWLFKFILVYVNVDLAVDGYDVDVVDVVGLLLMLWLLLKFQMVRALLLRRTVHSRLESRRVLVLEVVAGRRSSLLK